MGKTKIEWCDRTWNPITGCPGPLVSPGCVNCYARRTAETRLRGRYGYDAVDPFKITFHPDRLQEPAGWKMPQRIFVGSMGDVFHEDVSIDDRERLFWEFPKHPNHTFMLLTKRVDVALWWFTDGLDLGALLPNVWLGVTICNQDEANEKIPQLLQIPAAKRFVSIEPMLGPVDLRGKLCHWTRPDGSGSWFTPVPGKVQRNLLDWVICGGETGPDARPMHPDWVRNLRDQCQHAGIPFFFKGWGKFKSSSRHSTISYAKNMATAWPDGSIGDGDSVSNGGLGTNLFRVGKKLSGRMLDGREWNERPSTKFEDELPF